jgi:hypothetical protein
MFEYVSQLATRLSVFVQDRDVWSDILSAMILILMILTIWLAGWRGYRPAKHLFEWICRYPVLAAFYGVFTLMSWGVVCTNYGVRTLLLSDDGLVQFLSGFTLIAVFLRLSFQYVVLDRSRERWFWTLDNCLDVWHARYGGDKEIVLTEETNENAGSAGSMKISELKRLLKRDVAEQPDAGKVLDVMDCDRFRLAMSPLILDFYASILIVFLGLIPPLIGISPQLQELTNEAKNFQVDKSLQIVAEIASRRGPWLVGIFCGVLLARSLVTSSTARFRQQVSEMVECAELTTRNRRIGELKKEWPSAESMLRTLREAYEAAHDRDERGDRTIDEDWRKLPFLSSVALMLLLILVNFVESNGASAADAQARASASWTFGIVSEVPVWLGIGLIAIVPLVLALYFVGYKGVWAVDMVGHSCGFVFRKMILDGRLNPVISVGLFVIAISLALAGFRFVLGERFQALVYPLLAVSASIVIQRLSAVGNCPTLKGRKTVDLIGYWAVVLCAVPVSVSSWGRTLGIESTWSPYVLGLLKYLIAIQAGTWMVRWTMSLFDPLISYPVAALWGFLAFSGFFVELAEWDQARIPASFTVIYFAGVLASFLTCILHSDSLGDPKKIAFAIVVTILLIGQGWTTSPNQFKLRFPGLDGQSMLPVPPGSKPPEVVNYYEQPVRLNSEAYFRITNRSVIKLHLQELTRQKNKTLSNRNTNRLASGMIPNSKPGPGVKNGNDKPLPNGLKVENGKITMRYFDEQNVNGDIRAGNDYLRLRKGDPLELIRLDTRFDFEKIAGGKKIRIEMIPHGLEVDFPKPEIAVRIYGVAETLSFKLTDGTEMDSGIRAALTRQPGGGWNADFEGTLLNADVKFDDRSIEIGGPFADSILAKIDQVENREVPSTAFVPVRMHKLDSAIVTATWPARVVDVQSRKVPEVSSLTKNGVTPERTEIDVRWPVEPNDELKKLESENSAEIVSFLHMAYLVSGAEVTMTDVQRHGQLKRFLGGSGDRTPDSVRNTIRDQLKLEGVVENGLRTGDCLSFEFLGWESPAKITDLVHFDSKTDIPVEWTDVLDPFRLSDHAMWQSILRSPSSFVKGFHFDPPSIPGQIDPRIAERFVETIGKLESERASAEIGQGNPKPDKLFSLRLGTQSGVFVHDSAFQGKSSESDDSRIVALYGSDRVRVNDRIVLKWYEPGGGRNVVRTGTFLIVDSKVELPESGRPPARYAAVLVKPIDTRGTEFDGGIEHSGDFQDEFPVGKLAGSWSRLESLDNYELLTAWKEANKRPAGQKPKLVIVTVSGGGIRSEVWTATVLEALDQNLGDGFSKSIRIITGASGGMVAASDFVGSMERKGLRWSSDHHPIPDPSDDGENRRIGYLTRNQLDSVIGQMIYSDIPGSLNPLPRKSDRGRTLEKSWARIARDKDNKKPSPFERSIRELAAGEAAGWRPSIVFTPMMVEDGRRLLISNLDLSFVTRNVSALLMEENRRKIKHAAYEINSTDRLINRADDLLSLSAVEFYRIFPDAWQFSVGTATRMSASFPWVAPAVSIPTIPPRRIVDAGYYDNFGVNLAALWLAEMRDWLLQNTSGILLIQIRDHESQSRRTDIDFDVETGKNASAVRETFDTITNGVVDRNVGHVLHPILTPLSGAATARSWTMSFRNDEQVELLDELFNERETEENAFFRTVVFECPVEASLSWNLSEEEIVNITSGFGSKDTGPFPEHESVNEAGKDAAKAVDPEKRENEQKRRMLEAIGIGKNRLAALRGVQIKELHENIFGNRKRIQLLKNWWNR